MTPASRLFDLRSRLMKARQAYYYGGTSPISDAVYDSLEDELRALSPDDPLLSEVGAPVPPDSILTKARHRLPMGSQNKVNSEAEFRVWAEKSAAGGALHASLKGDGASAAAYYEEGRLRQVISRGDGLIGEDITANAVHFKGLPIAVGDATGPFTGAVRLEVILTVEDWALVDPLRAKNPRNAGAGIMGRKNGEQARLLSCYAFGIEEQRSGQGVPFKTESEKIQRLSELGFQVISNQLCVTADEAVAYFEGIKQTRSDLPFWIDGVVFKVDDAARQEKLGEIGGRPRGQIAWKFDSQGALTVVESYSVSVGHTGALIPTAQLRPVQIGGTTVSSALLANWDEIARLDVAVGDTVWLIKANDIIPKVIEVRERPATRQPIAIPEVCPVCGGKVSRRRNTGGDEGVILECTQEDCPARSSGKLKRWIKSLDIQGLGDSVRHALVETFGVEDASGLYRLRERPEALAELIVTPEKALRLGAKRAATILEQIEAHRRLTLVEFLGSLGIERLAQRRVELMQKQAKGALDTLADWRVGKLRDPAFAASVGVPSVGALLQDTIDSQAQVIDNLLAAGVEITPTPTPTTTESPQLTVCITGKLPSGRAKGTYAEGLRGVGAELVDAVTQELSALVVANPDGASSKLDKARKWGIPLLSEVQLEHWIESGERPF
jgi:DNA ligase (NAD+)